VNFGVVLNETMGDEVKITVIATGFQREGQPMGEPLRLHAPMPAEPARPAVHAMPAVEVAEPLTYEEAVTETEFRPPEPLMPAAPLRRPEGVPVDDIDMPAILRRERRLFQ
jgi:cell division protein FtsZ